MHHHHVMILMRRGGGGGDGDGGVNCSHTKRFVVEVVAMKLRMMRMKGKRRKEQQEWEYSYIYEFPDIGLPCLTLFTHPPSALLSHQSKLCSTISNQPTLDHKHHIINHPTNIPPCCLGGTQYSAY